MDTQIKVTCSRCNGSGRFSFNLKDGDRCYGCQGAGFQFVDAAKHAKAQTAKVKRDAKKQADRAKREEIAAQVAAELDAEFGPFADDMSGAYARVTACQRAYGKTPGDIVCERLRAK